jgi:Putative adhesin
MSTEVLAPSVPKRIGSAWLVVGAVLAAVLVLVGAYTIVTNLAYRRLSPSVRTFRSPVRVLDVDVDSGSVVVEPWSGVGASVTSTVTQGTTSPSNVEAVAGGMLRINSSCGASYLGDDRCKLDVMVRVPAVTKVTVETEDGDIRANGVTGSLALHSDQGDVTVIGARGRLDLSSGQGDVTVIGARGRLALHSDQGEVDASRLTSAFVTATSGQGDVNVAFAAAPGDVLATSAQGSVSVDLPKGPTAYRILASSSQGSVSTGAVHSDSTSRRVVTATSGQGDVSVRYGGP